MSLPFIISLFAASAVGILLCEQFFPFHKRFFYSIATACFLCCVLACFHIDLYTLCMILLAVSAVCRLLFDVLQRILKNKDTRYAMVLNEKVADGWVLAYCKGCVLLMPEKSGTVRKGGVLKTGEIGKERILYRGE